MSALAAALDRLMAPDPSAAAFGYHDSQPSNSYEPLVEHTRQTLHDFLSHVQRNGPIDTVLQIGLGRRGGTHRAFRLLARQIVTVERDAERVRAFVARGIDTAAEVVILGDSGDRRTQAAVQARIGVCDLLLLDGGDTYSQCRADWFAYEPLVRAGGLVAIVDRSQVWPSTRRRFDVDRFVFDLERHHLLPRGARVQRFGIGEAIHCYQKLATCGSERATLPWPRDFVEAPVSRRLLPDANGFSIHVTADGYVAVAELTDVYDPRARMRNEYRLVLQHGVLDDLHRLVDDFVHLRGVAESAINELARGNLDGFRQLAAGAGSLRATFDTTLLPSLLVTPDNAELQRVFGAWQLLRGDYDVGAMMLRRLLSQNLNDTACLVALANVHLHLRDDEPAARQLLGEVRSRIRQIDIERICYRQLYGHALWAHPRCLRGIERCVWVGNGAEAGAKAWRLLGLGSFHGFPAAGEVCIAGSVDRRDAYHDRDHDVVSYHRWSTQFAARNSGRNQLEIGAVVTVTLDDLTQRGLIEPTAAQLLVVDVPGEELAILQSAATLLPHVDLLCVTVYHDSVFIGGSPQRDLLEWLEKVGLAFLGSEPTGLGYRSHAMFRRPGGRRLP